MIRVNVSSLAKLDHSLFVSWSGQKHSWACVVLVDLKGKLNASEQKSYMISLDENWKDPSFPKCLFSQLTGFIFKLLLLFHTFLGCGHQLQEGETWHVLINVIKKALFITFIIQAWNTFTRSSQHFKLDDWLFKTKHIFDTI